MSASFLVSIGNELVSSIQPLEDALQSPEEAAILLQQHGWLPPEDSGYVQALHDVLGLAEGLADLIGRLDDLLGSGPSLAEAEELVELAVDLFSRVRRLIEAPPTGMPPPLDQGEFWHSFPEDLAGSLVAAHLRLSHPLIFAPLHLLGIVNSTFTPAQDRPYRVDYTRWEVRWDRLGQVLSGPEALMKDVYAWGGAFDHGELLRRLELAALTLGLPAGRHVLPEGMFTDLYTEDTELRAGVRAFLVPLLVERDFQGSYREVGLGLLPVPPAGQRDVQPAGLSLFPYFRGSAAAEFPLGGPFTLRLRGGFEVAEPVRVDLFPDKLALSGSLPQTTLDLAATLDYGPDQPLMIVGEATDHHLQLDGASLGLEVSGPAGDPELVIRLAARQLALVLHPDEGDLLAGLLGNDPIALTIDADLAWSQKRGFSIGGQIGLTLSKPLDLSLGFLRVQRLQLALEGGDKGLKASATVTAGAHLGPVTVSLDQVGMALSFRSAPDHQGSFGDLDLSFDIQAPSGVGIAVAVGPVQGAGALSLDPGRGLYAGALQVQVSDRFGLSLLGLLQTKLPDGTQGLSLLASGRVRFPSPIPLGMGFVLQGAGALFGLHRQKDPAALFSALQSGQLGGLLFPDNPLADIGGLIAGLTSVFPYQYGSVALGILAEIGWLAFESLAKIELALLYDTARPLRLDLVGRLRIDAEVIKLNVLGQGTLDLGEGSLFLWARLYDSQVAGLKVSGDAAVLVRWNEPSLALSIGGFHPRYPTPVGFPALRRVTIQTPENPVFGLTLQAYLAVVGGTLQFGANLAVWVGIQGFLAFEGGAGFNALVHLSFESFRFEADLWGYVSLKLFGMGIIGARLEARIAGPGEWYVAGNAIFSFLWWDISKDFEVGTKPEAPERPKVDVAGELRRELTEARSWSGTSDEASVVSLRGQKGTEIRVHPQDDLQVSQGRVPLGFPITRFGDADAEHPASYTIDEVQIGTMKITGSDLVPIKAPFAPGLFMELGTEAQKLRRGGFEKLPAGVRIELSRVVAQPVDVLPAVLEAQEWVFTESRDQPDTPAVMRPVPVLLPLEQVEPLIAAAAATVRTRRTRRLPSSPRHIEILEPQEGNP